VDEAAAARRGSREARLDDQHRDGDTAEGGTARCHLFSGANPKNLALTLAASASIAEAGLDGVDTGIALAAVRDFMSDNNAVIKMVVLLLLGATMLGDGLAALWR